MIKKDFINPIKNYFFTLKQQKLQLFILVGILFVGAFLRLYKIDQYMTFLGDEGRDAIVVRRLLVDFDPILIGPGTSIGDMYLGPLYYYMMAPAMLLSGLSPVGPAIMIALLGVVTIWFVWHASSNWFPSKKEEINFPALFAAFLYAISPTVIFYSRSSWNPNIMPFFSLLSIWSVYKIWVDKNLKYLITLGISFAFVLQSHYLGFLILPTIAIFWLLTLKDIKFSKSSKIKNLLPLFKKLSLKSVLVFSLLMSPLLLFDIRHNWMNLNAMKIFFTQRQTTVSARPWTAIPKVWPLFTQYIERVMAAKSTQYTQVFSLTILVLVAIFLISYKKINKISQKAFVIILTWLFISLIGYGLYKQHIYDHYFGLIYPAGFIFLSGIFYLLSVRFSKYGLIAAFFVFALLVKLNLENSLFNDPPNNQLRRARIVTEKVIDLSEGKNFNFALIAKSNYESGYVYYFEKNKTKYLPLIADRPETITDQLFVVCELPKSECDPETNTRPEMEWFGWRKIVNSWDIEGVTLYKLVH